MIKLPLAFENLKKQFSSPKRRIQLFLTGFVVIYFVWAFGFFNPLRTAKTEFINKVQTLQTKLLETTQQINAITEAVKDKTVIKEIAEEKELKAKMQKVEQALAKTQLLLISREDWIKLKKAIVNLQTDMDNKITLQSIKDLPVQQWIPEAADKMDAAAIIPHTIYQHALEVKFQADYFSTIKYIARLEKLPWSVYWDSLDYRVLDYPQAQVILKFHVFTHEQSEA